MADAMRGGAVLPGTVDDSPSPSNRWMGTFHYVARVVTEAIFPRQCLACGDHWTMAADRGPDSRADTPEAVLADVFQQVAHPHLCPACIRAFEPMTAPLCTCCGVMFPSRIGENHRCGTCIRHPVAYRQARSAGVYTGGLMALIHHLKYRACLALRDPLARLLQAVFAQHWPEGEVDMVLPIPLHARRWRERGFNQAQMLVDAWAPSGGAFKRDRRPFPRARRILVRSQPTLPQTGLGKRDRRQNIRGAFAVIAPRAVKGAHILLVDDVYTTGATADEAARALMRSGAACVDVLTVARTMPRSRSQQPLTMLTAGPDHE